MEALRYETLVRRAFGYKLQDGRILDRWGDPASLANTDAFYDSNLPAVKVAAGYAMAILTTDIINSKAGALSQEESERLEAFTGRVVNSKDVVEVDTIIQEFVDTVEDQYFQFNNGIMTLK